MKHERFSDFLPAWAVRTECENAAALRAEERHRNRVRLERELTRLDAALERLEQAEQARELAEAEEVYNWMLRNGPRRAGGGRGRVTIIRTPPDAPQRRAAGPVELRQMLADARKNGRSELTRLLEQTLARAEGRQVDAILERSGGGGPARVVGGRR